MRLALVFPQFGPCSGVPALAVTFFRRPMEFQASLSHPTEKVSELRTAIQEPETEKGMGRRREQPTRLRPDVVRAIVVLPQCFRSPLFLSVHFSVLVIFCLFVFLSAVPPSTRLRSVVAAEHEQGGIFIERIHQAVQVAAFEQGEVTRRSVRTSKQRSRDGILHQSPITM